MAERLCHACVRLCRWRLPRGNTDCSRVAHQGCDGHRQRGGSGRSCGGHRSLLRVAVLGSPHLPRPCDVLLVPVECGDLEDVRHTHIRCNEKVWDSLDDPVFAAVCGLLLWPALFQLDLGRDGFGARRVCVEQALRLRTFFRHRKSVSWRRVAQDDRRLAVSGCRCPLLHSVARVAGREAGQYELVRCGLSPRPFLRVSCPFWSLSI
mmetsp:Transcript_10660/g.29556  ORF Transcript_10660/g.29556 Transcript_10660/m.29556 type:complete len:207 (-) Transcript_10660:542-1162(-)